MRRAHGLRSDSGAAAVEFALLAPLLLMILFGIIQYGYGFYELQAFRTTVDDASRLAATGIEDCAGLDLDIDRIAAGNGLDPDKVGEAVVRWTDAAGGAAPAGPVRLGYAEVVLTYEPFRMGAPLVPFPERFSESSTALVQDIGLGDLAGCG